MRLGISITPLVIFICLNFQLSYSQTRYGDGEGNGQFKGHPCDDTEVRNYAGLPAWKNYGEWLSECDSLADAYADSTFAIILKERHKQQAIEDSLREVEIASIDFDEELDMDAMWDNTIWNEIVDIAETEAHEVENITAVSGVRGAEAEDEALALLYYRRSMRGLSELDLQRALGKLIIKRQKMSDDSDTKKIDSYILQLKTKIKKV
jgi:hypothetical protein